MAQLRVVSVGPLVSVQDGGRIGLARFGVPQSGPMDRRAHCIANQALGNPAGAAAIEVSRGGLVVVCEAGPVTLALAGGGFSIRRCDQSLAGKALVGQTLPGQALPGQTLPSWCVATLHSGQSLIIRPGHWGSWTYLALPGLEAWRWLGSAATHLASGLGGGLLQEGQILRLADRPPRPDAAIPRPVTARPGPVFRVVMGPQQRFFAPETLAGFLSQPFTLTDASDRMGVRLSGPPLPIAALDMPSEPILRGSIQVAGDGVATVLLADHQTTGGYPKIATLLSQDTDRFAQLRPRDRVWFTAITPQQAIAQSRTSAASFTRYLAQFTPEPAKT